jgi:hypothetical protein
LLIGRSRYQAIVVRKGQTGSLRWMEKNRFKPHHPAEGRQPSSNVRWVTLPHRQTGPLSARFQKPSSFTIMRNDRSIGEHIDRWLFSGSCAGL